METPPPITDLRLNLRRLKLGKHTFSFPVHTDLFERFTDAPEVTNPKLTLDLEVVRQETLTDIRARIYGELDLACDRCLEPFLYNLDTEARVIFTSDEGMQATGDEDIVYLKDQDMQIDLAQDVYDWVMLAIPFRKVPCTSLQECETCPPNIKALFVEELPEEKTDRDSPWEGLKSLIDE